MKNRNIHHSKIKEGIFFSTNTNDVNITCAIAFREVKTD
jgi:hypothetical protein